MSNIIDSIRLSGTTYQIQCEITIDAAFDSGSTNPVENRVITPAVTKHFEGEYPTEYTGGYSGGTYVGGFSAETYEEAASYVIRNTSYITRMYKDGIRMKFIDAEGVETEVFACSASTYYDTVYNPPSSYATITIDTVGKNIEITPLDNYKLSYVCFYGYYDGSLMISTNNAFSALTYQSFDKTAIQLIDELSTQKQDKIPISAGTGTNSIIEGSNTSASGTNSHAEGSYTTANGNASHAEGKSTSANGLYAHAEGQGTSANGNYSHTEGNGTVANNRSEHASGQYNVSNSATTTFGNSGNTLFSVGNGTADYARHNAFEIRQNGDIYLSSGGTDIKLQDHLGGGSITVSSAITSGDTNPVQGGVLYDKFDEVEQVTARALNGLAEADEVTARALIDLHDSLSGKADTSAVTAVQDSLSGYVATSAVTTAVTSGSTSVITSGGVYQQMGGLKLVKLTQAQYNALTTKNPSILYVIVD